MPFTDVQAVRSKITDYPKIADVTTYGDGSATMFALSHLNITSGTAFVAPGGAWSATGATFDSSGFVSLGTAVSAGSGLRWRYVHSTFSDDEISHWLGVGGSVRGAAVEAVQTLMFDGLRRASWRAADGSEYDDTKTIGLLKTLYDTLKDEEFEAAAGGGGFESWAVNQGDSW